MRFNISTQHMKYGKKGLDKTMTPGYKRIGLLRKGLTDRQRPVVSSNQSESLVQTDQSEQREPTSNFISSYRYHQKHLKPIWSQFNLRKTKLVVLIG